MGKAGVLIWQTHYGPTVDQLRQQQASLHFLWSTVPMLFPPRNYWCLAQGFCMGWTWKLMLIFVRKQEWQTWKVWRKQESWPKSAVYGTIKSLPMLMRKHCRPGFCQGSNGLEDSRPREKRSPFTLQVCTKLGGAILNP
jgi:hypothetical protein